MYARELLKRIDALRPSIVVAGAMGGELETLLSRLGPEVQLAQAWGVAVQHLHPEVEIWTETAGVAGLGRPGRLAVVGVWAEPEALNADRILHSFQSYLAAGSRLCVLLSGPLARALPELKATAEGPAVRPGRLRRTARLLRRAGFAVDAVYGFHGPASIAWGCAHRALQLIGRRDLADRALVRGYLSYVVHGWQAHLAPVRMLLVTKREQPL